MTIIMTLRMNDDQLHSIECGIFYCFAECRYSECCYAECRDAKLITDTGDTILEECCSGKLAKVNESIFKHGENKEYLWLLPLSFDEMFLDEIVIWQSRLNKTLRRIVKLLFVEHRNDQYSLILRSKIS
jgi:hypothetical protein